MTTIIGMLPFILIGAVIGMIAMWIFCWHKASRNREEAELEAALEDSREIAAAMLAAQVPDGDKEETRAFDGKFLG